MKYFWFGDSWVVGDELEHGDAFPQIVSRHRGAQCINLGECGSSIDEIPYHFFLNYKEICSGDMVFFCLTAPHRVSMFKDGSLKRIIPNEMYEKHRPHAFKNQWFKYFDDPDQRLYNRDKSINLLYFWAKSLGIQCWFANIFTIEPRSIMDLTPDSQWLVPRSDCLAGAILPVIDDCNLHLSDNPDLTNEQWHQQQTAIEQFIKPNYAHPNAIGHLRIAEMLLQKLSYYDSISI